MLLARFCQANPLLFMLPAERAGALAHGSLIIYATELILESTGARPLQLCGAVPILHPLLV